MIRVHAIALAGWMVLSACEARSARPPSEPAPVAEKAATPAPAAKPKAAEPVAPNDVESFFVAASEAERAQEPERAAALYQRACELGLGQACHRLGVMHQEGKGVARDEDKARELFGVGCRQDSAAACDALGH